MHAQWKSIQISLAFSFLFKNKTNKKDVVPRKTHLWARTRQLAISESLTNQRTFRGEWSVYDITHNCAVWETTE